MKTSRRNEGNSEGEMIGRGIESDEGRMNRSGNNGEKGEGRECRGKRRARRER